MTVFERIKKLTAERSKTMKQVTSDLGYSENYFYSLKSGKQPTAERLNEIADYFNVSVDYLLGRTDDPQPTNNYNSGHGSDLMGYFRLNTEGFDEEEAEQIEESLKDYASFLVQKARERKAREKN